MTIARGWSVTPVAIHNRIAFYSVMLSGALIYWHWEAMIISYLAVRTIVLPFNSIEELLQNTDTNVSMQCNWLERSERSDQLTIFWSDFVTV
jgi:hypothetical protein